MVKIYSLKNDGNRSLSKNFTVREFRCRDGSDLIKVSPETVAVLQAIRDYFGRPVTINSAYRTPEHNARVGGAKSSQHVKGTACDIRVSGVPARAVAAYVEAEHPGHGIGSYPTFVHVDSRGYKVLWKDTGSHVVKTFGAINYKQYKAPDIPDVVPVPEEEAMTDREIYEAVQRHARTLPVPDWAKAELQEAVDRGITDGTNPMELIPRYQAAIMAKRASEPEGHGH